MWGRGRRGRGCGEDRKGLMATARRFAVAMGLTALAAVCATGMWWQWPLERTLWRGLVALVAFAGIGYACGLMGAAIMKEAAWTELRRVKERLERKLWGPGSGSKAGSSRAEAEGSGEGQDEKRS